MRQILLAMAACLALAGCATTTATDFGQAPPEPNLKLLRQLEPVPCRQRLLLAQGGLVVTLTAA